MLLRHLAALIIASTASAFFSMDAAANPRFSVENQSGKKVEILVFSGDDSACTIPEKSKKLRGAQSRNIGCAGGGKGRCKVRVMYKGGQACGNANTSCNGTAISVKNGRHLVLTNEDGCYTE